eukprot:TRINITY_DN30480_c0_g1_i1.p2 TRINITY_DN30480_c0_g1~~TRINITY_DN30480_c0_g1_i1.p2  ORF type:complete len:259 (+),score=82.37 TRINITY_DN30480_c0_g1_i1:67-843(+)
MSKQRRSGYEGEGKSSSKGDCLHCGKAVQKQHRRVRSASRDGYYHMECEQKHRQEAAAAAPELRCRKGHVLQPWLGDDGLFCDSCLRDVPSGSRMHGCRKCDFDLCERCAAARRKGAEEDTDAVKCEEGHPVTPFIAADTGWVCMGCGRDATMGMRMVGCKKCDFAFCEPCFEIARERAADDDGAADDGVFECENECGFKGTFDEVSAHEQQCGQPAQQAEGAAPESAAPDLPSLKACAAVEPGVQPFLQCVASLPLE